MKVGDDLILLSPKNGVQNYNKKLKETIIAVLKMPFLIKNVCF